MPPLTGVYGDTGSGKTTMVVYILAKFFNSVEKYGNFDCKLPKWKKVSILQLTELPETNNKRIVVFDEGYTEYDNRRSMDDEQTFNTYLLMQHRKANMSIIGISQLNILDVRWRGLEKFSILCKDRAIYNRDGSDFKGDFTYYFLRRNHYQKFVLPYRTALKIFPLFKTKEKIMPRGYERMKRKMRMDDPEERTKIINEVVKKIESECVIPEKITRDWVANALLEIEEDLALERYVYVRLKNR